VLSGRAARLPFHAKAIEALVHGYIQNVRLHWRGVLHVPGLRSAIAVTLWDGVIASFGYLVLIPLLAILLMKPMILLAYTLPASCRSPIPTTCPCAHP
jgi:poly-beta-1,6-N-acetyl-D-glucosamine synthase